MVESEVLSRATDDFVSFAEVGNILEDSKTSSSDLAVTNIFVNLYHLGLVSILNVVDGNRIVNWDESLDGLSARIREYLATDMPNDPLGPVSTLFLRITSKGSALVVRSSK